MVSVVQNAWAAAKRRANVILVVDTSGSMNGDKLTGVQAALRTFLAQIPSDQERLGLVEFNSGVTNVIEMDTLAKNRGALDARDRRLASQRQHRVPGRRAHRVSAAPTDRRSGAHQRDCGDDRWPRERVGVTLQQLVDEVRTGNQKVPVIIFSVAYGNDADMKLLESLSTTSGGQVRAGTPETIRDLYKILSSYF